MTILTLNDFYTVISEEELLDICEGNLYRTDNAELVAIGEAVGYLSVRHDAAKAMDRTLIAPSTAVPPEHDGYKSIPTVLEKLVDIAVHNLFARITPHNIPKMRQDRYDNAIQWLEKVADGFIAADLPIKTTGNSTPLRYGNSSTTEDRYY